MNDWEVYNAKETIKKQGSLNKAYKKEPELMKEYIYTHIVVPRFLRKVASTSLQGKNKKYFDDYVEGKRWRGSIRPQTLLTVSPLLKEAFDELVSEELINEETVSAIFDDFYSGTLHLYDDRNTAESDRNYFGRKYKVYDCLSTFDSKTHEIFRFIIQGVTHFLFDEYITPAIDKDWCMKETTGQTSKLAKTKINDLYALGVLVEG